MIILLKLMRVIGTTKDNLLVVGDLIGGKIYKSEKTYYVRNNDGIIVECISCIEDSKSLEVRDNA
jgi:hypothetical protein